MRLPSYSGQFKRDVKAVERRGHDMAKLRTLLSLLIAGEPLPRDYRDHPLKGDWEGYRDAHIESDWLLIYKASATAVHFERTGTHTDLFD
ncbi:MAG: type II toxin-antitoxin system YafQ family toxin [Magnetococcus sp. YQC-5]